MSYGKKKSAAKRAELTFPRQEWYLFPERPHPYSRDKVLRNHPPRELIWIRMPYPIYPHAALTVPRSHT
ncbi:MAG TPA: hypothetical protein VFD70_15375 [Anaerolineae bacterium]|nr:hypothetical protein [Anaerolineae bacterium]